MLIRVGFAIVMASLAISAPSFAREVQDEPSSSSSSKNNDKLEFFEKKIRPILYDNCFNCHSADNKEAGGLRVDDHRALLKGGNTGAAVVPGKPQASVLIKRVTHADDKKTMPPDYRLSAEQIELLTKWIADGAVWPEEKLPEDIDQTFEDGKIHYEDLAKSHWAWQPLLKAEAPGVSSFQTLSDWPRNEIDKFVAAQLEKSSLKPVSDSGKSQLLRRIYFDLTGLPPTEDAWIEFLADESPKAFESVVDRLLESPSFGERWGRHWLDVARYGESTGSARNLPYPHAWRYRDYVIESFNNDKPFNQFVLEQVAGDLLPATSLADKKQQLIATGFLTLGVKDVNQRFKVRYDMDNVDEQIDTVSKAFLGLTVSCARCHDHKFDPVSTRDYYALAGIFTSTEHCDSLRNQMGGAGMAYYVPDRVIKLSDSSAPAANPEAAKLIETKKEEARIAREKFVSIRDSVRAQDRDADRQKQLQEARQAMLRAQEELVSLTDPAKTGPVAMGVRDSQQIADTAIRIRGEAEKHGPVVKRGYLAVLSHVPGQPIPDYESGRHQLARWIVHPQNSLTQRVIVNRIWKNLFGEGLVRTVDNFGSTGDTPSHPELLDFLAAEFVKGGWSTKKLVRTIVLSRSYQLSSQVDPVALKQDPDNRSLWRHSPRRLDSEEIRDAMLLASGRLVPDRPTDSPATQLVVREIRNNGPEAKNLHEYVANSQHRSVYLPVLRTIVPDTLAAFDFVEQGMVTGKREATTVAPQALYLLNSGFVRTQAAHLAKTKASLPSGIDQQKIAQIYRQLFLRQPTKDELREASEFIDAYRREFESGSATPVVEQTAALASTTAQVAGNEPRTPTADDDRSDSLTDSSFDVTPKVQDPNLAAWTAWTHALFCSAEFRYLK